MATEENENHIRQIPRTPPSNSPPSKAARLPYFSQAWQQVTSNSFILNIVINGYNIQFTTIPIQNEYIPRSMSPNSIQICKSKVTEFKKFKIIKVVTPSHDQYISHIFPRPKKSLGEYRVIFDLSELNEFVRKIHFKMDRISEIMEMIKPGDFFISIDLSDAYYCIAMHILSMPFLTFIFLGIYYQFTCLPQGLTSAPRIFTKVMRVVLSHLRYRSIRIAAWIDDFLVAASSREKCQEHAFITFRTFEELGFVPNTAKSQLVPVQRICHLGLIWDSVDYSVGVPYDKIVDVRSKCARALSSSVPVRFLSSILGSIEYFRWGFPHAALHYRRLQRFVNSCLGKNPSYDIKVVPSSEACIDLSWWSKIGDSLPTRSLSPFTASLEVTCDACTKVGWGCWSSTGKEAFGGWSSSEKKIHINILEFTAVMFAFKCFFRHTYNCSILINSDSSTVVAYINKQGGTASKNLCDLAIELWDFCIARKICIHAKHLPGIKNTRADKLSRMEQCDHSYSLTQEFFDVKSAKLPFLLTIDCFASRLNFKTKKFVSHYYDPLSSWVDAFSISWVDNVYLFPPLPLINRTISKFIADKTGHGLLVCPYWPSQPWFPSLLELLIAPPFSIPPDSLMDSQERLPRSCQLVGWPIGSNHAERMAFQGRLGYVGSKALIRKPSLLTKSAGENLAIGIINGRVITVE